MADRGAYMAINASLQQLAGGIASGVAGLIVVQSPSGKLERYGLLGWVVASVMALTVLAPAAGMLGCANQDWPSAELIVWICPSVPASH